MGNRAAVEPRNVDPKEHTDLLSRQLGTRHEGLSERDAARWPEQCVPNEIRHLKGDGHQGTFIRQFAYPLALMLRAALLAFVDGVAIMAVIFLNAVFAFVQYLQAEKATEALKRYPPPPAHTRPEPDRCGGGGLHSSHQPCFAARGRRFLEQAAPLENPLRAGLQRRP